MRWNPAGDGARTMRQIGGEIAYEADVTLNGGSGRLAVARFQRDIGQVVHALAGLFSPARIRYAGGSMGLVESDHGGRCLRFLALRIGKAGETMVFGMDQSAREAAASRRPPRSGGVGPVPPYPAARPRLLIRDRNAGLSLGVSNAPAQERDVLAFYRERLASEAWRPAAPGDMSAGMRVFERGSEVCVVHVECPPGRDEARITLLHKQQGIH